MKEMFKNIVKYFKYYGKTAFVKPECRKTKASIKGKVIGVYKGKLVLSIFDYGLCKEQTYDVEELEFN